jgi:hypothetical protein
LKLNPEAFGASGMAIYGAALAAVGRREEAARVQAGIDWVSMPDEEAAALRKLIAQHAG